MRALTLSLILIVSSIPVALFSYTLGRHLTESEIEAMYDRAQFELDNCLMREKFEGLRTS